MTVDGHTMNIAFAGLTAAGKTTHARRLAADLGYDYVSATDILFEILRVPRNAHPWFNQADAISSARDDGLWTLHWNHGS